MMFKFVIIGLIIWAAGIWMGKVDKAIEIAALCDSDFNVEMYGREYVCMRVNEEGLAQNNEQLKEQYKF